VARRMTQSLHSHLRSLSLRMQRIHAPLQQLHLRRTLPMGWAAVSSISTSMTLVHRATCLAYAIASPTSTLSLRNPSLQLTNARSPRRAWVICTSPYPMERETRLECCSRTS
ncbi:hypothetical protein DXG01_000861, partial [Tephrocybe rancida]